MGADTPKILSVNCNHCGATLDIDESARFVTCAYCHSRLAVQRTDSAVFTEVLEKIEQMTGQIADNLKVIQLQNDLGQLDREWQNSREDLMVSGRNGSKSSPSIAMGLTMMVVAVVGGGFWTLMAVNMRAPGFFPMFGLLFILVGVAGGASSMAKAGKLDETRSAYESRRRELLDAIAAEKLK